MNSNDSGHLKIESRISEKLDSYGTLDYSVRHVRWLLRLLGVWPLIYANSSSLEKKAGKIVRPIAMFYASYVLIPMFAEVISQRAPREELISLGPALSYQVANVLKFIFLLLRVNVVKMSMHHMEVDWQKIDNDEDRAIMVRNLQTANKVAIVITISVYLGGTLYNLILPALAGSHLNELNETIRVLCFPGGDLFFNVQAHIVFEVVYFNYWIADMYVITISMSLFTLALVLLSHTCGQIDIVVSKLKALGDCNQDDTVLMENRIAMIIRSHVRLLKFSMQIEEILKEICAMEVISGSLNVCTLGYITITDAGQTGPVAIFTYVLLLFVHSFNLFMYCEIGETLIEQCQNVGKAAYMTEWYKLPAKTSLNLIMIMNVSARPRQLTAGGLMDISRINFAAIMKTSVVYLNMLRTMA